MKPSEIIEWRLVAGWCYPTEADWLYDQVMALPDGAVIVEVGSWMGKSTVALALGCVNTSKRVFTVDHFQGSSDHRHVPGDLRARCEENLERLGVADYVTIIEGESVEVAASIDRFEFEDMPIYIDLLYLDGSHEEADVEADIRAWRPLVDGIFAIHDAAGGGAWESVKVVVDREFEGVEQGECGSIAYFDLRGTHEDSPH